MLLAVEGPRSQPGQIGFLVERYIEPKAPAQGHQRGETVGTGESRGCPEMEDRQQTKPIRPERMAFTPPAPILAADQVAAVEHAVRAHCQVSVEVDPSLRMRDGHAAKEGAVGPKLLGRAAHGDAQRQAGPRGRVRHHAQLFRVMIGKQFRHRLRRVGVQEGKDIGGQGGWSLID